MKKIFLSLTLGLVALTGFLVFIRMGGCGVSYENMKNAEARVGNEKVIQERIKQLHEKRLTVERQLGQVIKDGDALEDKENKSFKKPMTTANKKISRQIEVEKKEALARLFSLTEEKKIVEAELEKVNKEKEDLAEQQKADRAAEERKEKRADMQLIFSFIGTIISALTTIVLAIINKKKD